ncbi:MAG: YbjN domain-containing protein [Gammaproteobacteria bacterium]
MNKSVRLCSPGNALLRLVAVLGMASLLWFAPGVRAAQEPTLVTKVTPEQWKNIMTGEGYAVSTTGNEGQLLWKIEGFSTYVYVQNDGQIILFRKRFAGNVPEKAINEWNRTKRFSTSYLDSRGRPNLKIYLVLKGGVGRDRIIDYLKTCHTSFILWVRHLRASVKK